MTSAGFPPSTPPPPGSPAPPQAGPPQAGPLPPGPPQAGPLPSGPPQAGPPAPGPVHPGAPGTGLEARQRLHPLSPLLNGAKSLVVIVAALSWQTLSQLGPTHFAMVVGALAVAVVIFSAIGWFNTGYQVIGRELRIADGLIWRRNRAIPLDRLQAVELRRPLLAQLTGLAELRLEVVGGGKTEAPLAYLTVRDAAVLRERLLALSGRTAVVAPGVSPALAAAEPAPLFRVRNHDLLISQLLTPQAFFLPVGVAWVITQFVLESTWSFVGIASTVTAMAGVLLQPIRRVLRDWDFRLGRDQDRRLVLHYGLVETRNQVVPPHRVQTLRVTWPLLWRNRRWLNVRLDIAGYSGPEPGDDKSSDRLLPVGDLDTARRLVAEVFPGVDLAALATSPPPLRARWLHPFSLRFHGAGLTPDVFVSRAGRVTREMSLVPYERLQSVRVVQGPLQRRLRLATVYADTAGGRSGVARDRDLAEAWAIAEQLEIRARNARLVRPAAPVPPAGGGYDPRAVPPGYPPPVATPPGYPPPPAVPPGYLPPAATPPAAVPPGMIPPGYAPPGAGPADETFWQRPPQP